MPNQLDPSIPLGARTFSIGNPFMEAFAGAQQLRAQRDAQQSLIAERNAQTAEREQATAAARRAQFEQEKLTELFSKDVMPEARQVYSVIGPQRGAEVMKALSALQEKTIETEDKMRAHVGALVGGINALPEGMRPMAYDHIRTDLITKQMVTPDQIPEAYSPEYVAAARQWALTPKEQIETEAAAARDKIAATTAAAQLPGQVAQSAIQQNVAAGMKGGLTPEQQQAAADRAANTHIAAGNLAVSQRRETREAGAAKQAAADVTQLTPEGLDAAATMFAKTGQLPALGMGDKTTRKQIINRAAALMPGLDVASAKADFGANSESLKNVTKTLDTLSAFENTAGKNLDQFLSLASKVPDTGVPWLNAPIRTVNASALGSAEQAAFNAARVVALREIARVTNDPKLSGVLSDSARKEVSDLSPQNATFAQIKAVSQTLKADMANVRSSLTDQKSAIGERIRKGAGGPVGGGGATHAVGDIVVGPDGQRHRVEEVSPDGKQVRLGGAIR